MENKMETAINILGSYKGIRENNMETTTVACPEP